MVNQFTAAGGWSVLDSLALTVARPDYRFEMEWWNFQSHLGEKRAGSGISYSIANALLNLLCNTWGV